MDNKQIASEWFVIAEKDILSAKYLQNMHPIPVEIICYHCQQSSEKYLKGFLVLNGHKVIKTHDLVYLNQLCCSYDESFKILEKESLRLTDYGVNIRYPYPMDLNIADMKLAIKDAEVIQGYILEKFEKCS
ncbi:MAG: HepN domain protein [Candidatus Magnetoglobus multicellularis str. Araruama]|uniref:HepN domain protein n=1 Tax=Candidatus Magnetoglobus multicellularis str. Araruama TaxID=890399 RepID=A0A1V1P216_9BACT|nr:MAG: HepN domain protein [Candidatus Magnetoglobus multicellularis str. Araruama]